MNNNESDKIISIYPNPSSGLLSLIISNRDNTDLIINILDINGRLVKNISSFNNYKTVHEIDLQNQNQGVYFVKVICNKEVLIRKIFLR